MDNDIKQAAERLLSELDPRDGIQPWDDTLLSDVRTVATWALGAGALEHVNCNAVKPCACRCSVCAGPEPANPPAGPSHNDTCQGCGSPADWARIRATVAPHDDSEGEV